MAECIYTDRLLQEQGTRVEEWSVSDTLSQFLAMIHNPTFRESNIDDVLQISNIFVNVSKGEVAKANDLEKAFGTSNTSDIVKEVRQTAFNIVLYDVLSDLSDPKERGSASRRKGTRARHRIFEEGACNSRGREMRRSFHTTTVSSRYDRESDDGGWIQHQDKQDSQEPGGNHTVVQ